MGKNSINELKDLSNERCATTLLIPKEHYASGVWDESSWREDELLESLRRKEEQICRLERCSKENKEQIDNLYNENCRMYEKIRNKDFAIEELINYIARLRENINE